MSISIRRRQARCSRTGAGGQGGFAGLLGLSPGGGAAEDVALAAPGGDVELSLGEAGQPAAAGAVDGGAVVVELADRGGDRFQDARRWVGVRPGRIRLALSA